MAPNSLERLGQHHVAFVFDLDAVGNRFAVVEDELDLVGVRPGDGDTGVPSVRFVPDDQPDVEGVVDVEGSGDVGGVGDGGRLELEAVHTPGHAPGSVCFVAATEDVAFTGDHVMLEVSPNPLLTLEPGNDDERTRSLPAYVESLDRIREVGASVGHAGHRGRIDDLPGRATEIADHHHERKERIAGLVGDAGSDGGTTAYGIMKELFPDLPVTEMFPGMSEVIGHLDLLEDEGRVETVEAAVDGAVVDEAAVDAVRRYRLV